MKSSNNDCLNNCMLTNSVGNNAEETFLFFVLTSWVGYAWTPIQDNQFTFCGAGRVAYNAGCIQLHRTSPDNSGWLLKRKKSNGRIFFSLLAPSAELPNAQNFRVILPDPLTIFNCGIASRPVPFSRRSFLAWRVPIACCRSAYPVFPPRGVWTIGMSLASIRGTQRLKQWTMSESIDWTES